MEEARTLLQDLALVFCVAAAVTLIFQRLRQPVVLGYLLAGLLVGPNLGLPLFADLHRIEQLSQLGVILVIFALGLEFRLGRLLKLLPTSGLVGIVQVPAMLWLGYLIGQFAGWHDRDSLFLGGMMCISSTMIVARALGDGSHDARLTDNVFGILIVQDLAAILLIAVFSALASGAHMPPAKVARIVAELTAFLAASVTIGMFIVPRLIREADDKGSGEVLVVTAVGTCFGLALLAEFLGYSVALGAFIAGSLTAESGRRKQVEQLIVPVRDLFAAVFFVSIGMLVDPRALINDWRMIAVVSLAVVLGQTFFVTIGSFLSGRSVGVSIRTGMTLAQIGEFSFIIVGIGVTAGAVSPQLMAIAVGVAVVTTFLTPLLIGLSPRAASAFESRLPRPLQTFAALYGSWVESLRASRKGPGQSGLRRFVVLVFLDVAVLAAIVVGAAIGRDPFAAELAARTQLSVEAAGMLGMAIALVVALPFVLGLARIVRRLGVDAASRVLPASHTGVDLADAPRRAFLVALELAVALLALVPLVALTQPFLPLYAGGLLLVVVLSALGFWFWRQATNLQGHVRAGAEIVLEALDKQRRPDAGEQPEIRLEELLPGLGPLVSVDIAADSPAVGQTLAQLDLRVRTGATVIAIRHADGAGIGAPSGSAVIAAGDVLMLTASSACIARAKRLLEGNPLDE